MQNIIIWINKILFPLFLALYSYQFVYLFVALFKKPQRLPKAAACHRYCILIAARNEENVIASLIASIHAQTYPQSQIDICVVADNCTDATAEIARKAGAYVVERKNPSLTGKGYALDYLIKNLPAPKRPDAYLIFDADNTLDPHYIEERNTVYVAGFLAATSYRNSCNYGCSWISAGYALWFLRESRYLNQARMQLGTSCAVSGTGFMVAARVIEQNNGWIHHLLTEDIEFSVDSVLHGIRIGYCGSAVVYDEQPVTFSQSWNQRLRWCKGFYQVMSRYGTDLFCSALGRRCFSAFDMMMVIAPAALISICTLTVNSFAVMAGLFTESALLLSLGADGLFFNLCGYYQVLFVLGAVTLITEWKQIHTSVPKKLLSCFTFPIFMFTYVPIALAALRKNVAWTPIHHRGYEIKNP